MTRVLGVDPSLSGTGMCWADAAYATCGGSGDQRLWVIYRSVRDTLLGDELGSTAATGRFDLVVMEDLLHSTQSAGRTGMAHGVARLACMAAMVPYGLVPPATLKVYACGKGNATKADLRMAWFQRTGQDVRDDNQVDAAWLRALGMDHLGAPMFDLPKTHRRALDKLVWPVPGGAA